MFNANITNPYFPSSFHSTSVLYIFFCWYYALAWKHTQNVFFWTKLIFKFSIYFTGVGLLIGTFIRGHTHRRIPFCRLYYTFGKRGSIYFVYCVYTVWGITSLPVSITVITKHLHLLEKSSSTLARPPSFFPRRETNVSVIRWNSSQNYTNNGISFAKVHDLLFVFRLYISP